MGGEGRRRSILYWPSLIPDLTVATSTEISVVCLYVLNFGIFVTQTIIMSSDTQLENMLQILGQLQKIGQHARLTMVAFLTCDSSSVYASLQVLSTTMSSWT